MDGAVVYKPIHGRCRVIGDGMVGKVCKVSGEICIGIVNNAEVRALIVPQGGAILATVNNGKPEKHGDQTHV